MDPLMAAWFREKFNEPEEEEPSDLTAIGIYKGTGYDWSFYSHDRTDLPPINVAADLIVPIVKEVITPGKQLEHTFLKTAHMPDKPLVVMGKAVPMTGA